MEHILYIFNPEHDLALANGNENYFPTVLARKMAYDLSALPVWYAGKESYVRLPFPIDRERAVEESGGLFPEVKGIIDLSEVSVNGVFPWGWNPMLIKRLLEAGIPDSFLPDERKMKVIRTYSHRSFAVSLRKILPATEEFCGSAVCLYTLPEVEAFVENHSACLLKAPWSGSGKGLFWCKERYNPPIQGWAKRILAAQQCVIGESIYNKVEDFAMEFYSDGGGKVTFAGYSLFYTDKCGRYKSNILASDEYILSYLKRYAGEQRLAELRMDLEKELSSTVGKVYTGFVGVDMMVCRFETSPEYRIHPCVEINLRMNMGMVARLFTTRYAKEGALGMFSINYFPQPSVLWNYHLQMKKAYPLQVKEGRIEAGYLSLTPVKHITNYCASVIVGYNESFSGFKF